MGASVALKLASEHPRRVASLVLGGLGYRDSDEWATLARRSAGELRAGQGLANFLHGVLSKNRHRARLTPRAVRAIEARNDLLALAALLEQSHELNVEPQELPRIAAPTLCLVGRQDPAHDQAARLVEAMPDCRLVPLRGNHVTAVNDPRFAEEIAGFISLQEEGHH